MSQWTQQQWDAWRSEWQDGQWSWTEHNWQSTTRADNDEQSTRRADTDWQVSSDETDWRVSKHDETDLQVSPRDSGSGPVVHEKKGKWVWARPGPRLWCHIFLFKPTALWFEFVPALIGRRGVHVHDIHRHSGAKLRIRGRGSGHLEVVGPSGKLDREAPVPLMLAISVDKYDPDGFLMAVNESVALLESTTERYRDMCRVRGEVPELHLFAFGDGSALATRLLADFIDEYPYPDGPRVMHLAIADVEPALADVESAPVAHSPMIVQPRFRPLQDLAMMQELQLWHQHQFVYHGWGGFGSHEQQNVQHGWGGSVGSHEAPHGWGGSVGSHEQQNLQHVWGGSVGSHEAPRDWHVQQNLQHGWGGSFGSHEAPQSADGIVPQLSWGKGHTWEPADQASPAEVQQSEPADQASPFGHSDDEDLQRDMMTAIDAYLYEAN
jgi:hypothetical protein